jgi:hypothetical protein
LTGFTGLTPLDISDSRQPIRWLCTKTIFMAPIQPDPLRLGPIDADFSSWPALVFSPFLARLRELRETNIQ